MSDFREELSTASTPLSAINEDEHLMEPRAGINGQERLILRLGPNPRTNTVVSDDVDMMDLTSGTSKPSSTGPRAVVGTRNTSKKNYQEVDTDDEEDFPTEESDAAVEAGESEDEEYNELSHGDRRRSGGNKNMKKKPPRKQKKSSTVFHPTVHIEEIKIPMGTKEFEKILNWRQNPENPKKEELLIKYKHMSYNSAEWVPKEQVEAEYLGKHRVRKFMHKYQQDGQKGENISEYLKIDRVIDEGELTDPATGIAKIYYLIKWTSQMYDACTWESREEVEKLDAQKITEFNKRRTMSSEKSGLPLPRPKPHQFVKLENSPTYKYGNELRSYQLEGLNWLLFCYYNLRSSILADEMGLGKTVQSVAFLNELYISLKITGPFLIVAPLSTIPHWERALKAWTDLNGVDFRGSSFARNLIVDTEFFYKDSQGRDIPSRYKFDVLITTYEMAQAGAAQLKVIPWRAAIFDEAHRLKNKASKVLDVLKGFQIEHKLLLTGTPLQNNLDELYSLLNFLQPDIANDEKAFFSEYGSLKTSTEVEKLQGLLKPIMLRRFKEDVEKTIPVKEETVIEVELTTTQKKWYRAILEKNFSFLKKGVKSAKSLPQLNNIMMQLRKCCIHPYLLQGAEEVIVAESDAKSPEAYFNCLIHASGKLVLIDKLLRRLLEGGHKVLIFSQFTSCLDILSDYLRGRQYSHERIDGSVRGDLRQAAIDRFCTLPIPESFVFLLCTRAGGVGINLTAADTVIIFDSDWNPQNDLQAQARCHRIGQTKPVQIYRLICRNTYEKEMFDKAGMKLGLDKAVMQRMDVDRSNEDDDTANIKNGMSKKEIEDLLKKGAYGAMLDDEASQQFCEEDIDQILERRTTIVRHEGNEKGSVFSKATFSTAAVDDMDINDPDFWDKWARKTNVDTTESPGNDLIMIEPRQRRQVQRFGVVKSKDGAASSDDSEQEQEKNKKKRDTEVRPWSVSERTKYERKLMIYGYGQWDLFKAHFSRRSEKDLRAVTRQLIRLAIPTVAQTAEEDVRLVQDIKEIIAEDTVEWDVDDENTPYSGASKKEIAEYQTFLTNAPREYLDHMAKKGRNFLIRLQMLHQIREKIVPHDWEEAKALQIPKVSGSPPSPWWGADEDRDLLLGIVKYGYQQYFAMRNDPEFCFFGKKYDDSQSGGGDDEDGMPAPTGDITKAEGSIDGGNESIIKEGEDVQTPSKVEEETSMVQDTDVPMEPASDSMSIDTKLDDEDPDTNEVLIWPSKADIGVRLRRIIAAFQREQASEGRRQRAAMKEELKEKMRIERQKQKEERVLEKQRQKLQESSNRWSKKNKSDFLRTIMSFGVETSPGDPHIHWERFKEIAGLQKKTDESLDIYYNNLMAQCQEIVRRHESELVVPTDDKEDSSRLSSVDPVNPQTADSPGGKSDDENEKETIPYSQANKLIQRVESMRTIRERVLVVPDLDDLLMAAKKTSGLPSWWQVPEHDRAFLFAICKHGVNRSDLIAADLELPFHAMRKQVEEDILSTNPVIEDPAQLERLVDEEFSWPKDLVIARRISMLCDIVLHPKQQKTKKLSGKKRKVDPESAVESTKKRKPQEADYTITNNQGLKMTLKVQKRATPESDAVVESDSGENTDDMLKEASKRTKNVKTKSHHITSKKSRPPLPILKSPKSKLGSAEKTRSPSLSSSMRHKSGSKSQLQWKNMKLAKHRYPSSEAIMSSDDIEVSTDEESHGENTALEDYTRMKSKKTSKH